MLSDKEKKAIELLEDHLICGNKEGVLYRNLRIISRIIEKQSKEIEELKEKNEYLPNWVSKKYVSKDKIKAKIDYLLKRYDSEEDFCSYDVLISILQSLLEKE